MNHNSRPSSRPSVSIVLLNWNRWHYTLACLESLFRLDYPNYNVIVCDNNSSDGSMLRLREWAAGRQPAPLPSVTELQPLVEPMVVKPIAVRELSRSEAESSERHPAVPLTLIQTGANLGFAGGCNVGVRYALTQGMDYVWLLNNDTLATPDSLQSMVDYVQSHPDIGMCGSTLLSLHHPSHVLALGGGRLRPSTGTTRHLGEGCHWPLSAQDAGSLAMQQMDYVVGASMLVSHSLLETVGLMDEGYFLYYEEIDWATRLPPRIRLGYAPLSVIYHREGGTTGGLARSHYYRSLIRFIWRRKRRYLPLVLARMASRVPEALLHRNWQELTALLSLLRPRRIPDAG
ncbi:MAG: glycosyltransferase family 2 protein [Candidatus Accumulibacter sp.]|uniref:Glycosyltransferase family 2 protein n=1 Tax=Candidatus Accumulibacter proximus TaxID=2954385 RepID=A0A935PYJ0_9PROT|nr:glycosyltransferase family 2 protein [Candidatus Accumulibacter proximus]